MAMPAPDYAPPSAPVDVLEYFLSLDTPPGYRAELIDREIIVTPPPDGNHEIVISEILEQFFASSAVKFHFSANKGLITPSGRFIPDVTIGAKGLFAGHGSWMPTNGVLLVLEVTSSGDPRRDREAKRKGYAAAGIPLYLLVDRQWRTVALYSDPDADTGDYLTVHNAPYGKDVPLPGPFDFALETSDF